MDKSLLYIWGVDIAQRDILHFVVRMPLGDFPFKYLSVPLTTRKLFYHECKPLIEKNMARVRAWSDINSHMMRGFKLLLLFFMDSSFIGAKNLCFLRKFWKKFKVYVECYCEFVKTHFQRKILWLGKLYVCLKLVEVWTLKIWLCGTRLLLLNIFGFSVKNRIRFG